MQVDKTWLLKHISGDIKIQLIKENEKFFNINIW